MENFENITPAINVANLDGSNQLSAEEFQKTLYHWFSKKGLVSEIRTYLRMKMIEALKSSNIGESLSGTGSSSNISLENQALNILFADHLFQQRYDYTLSVFSAEVPIKTLVSEYCFFVFSAEMLKTRHKIDEKNVICIVESLGINVNSDVAQEILLNYRELNEGSLLLCILQTFMTYYKPEKPSEDSMKDGHVDEIGRTFRRMLVHYDLPNSITNHLIEKMNFIVKNQVNAAVAKLTKHFEQEKFILRAEYDNKETEFKEKLKEVDKYLNDESKKIDMEHKRLVYLIENMVSNEDRVAEKSRDLENKVKKVNDLEAKLTQELQNCAKIKAAAAENCKSQHCDKQCEEIKREIEELRIQKRGFENIAENQNILISNLTAKSNIMYKQLQEGMQTIADLRSQLAKQKEILERERRRRNVEHTSERTVSSSDVLTVGTDGEGDHNIEDAIKQSHLKFDELEKESNEIERKYKQFRSTLRQPQLVK